jgi:Fur family transcriptional regulator, ferric uptake regulator
MPASLSEKGFHFRLLNANAAFTMLRRVETGRNRRNRAALLRAGREMGRAFSVRELHAAAQVEQPSLGLTTAYRAVERWRDEGLAEEAGSRGGEAVYILCSTGGHHHHVVCVDCGASSTLDGCALGEVRELTRRAGFELVDEALGALPGRCADCATR